MKIRRICVASLAVEGEPWTDRRCGVPPTEYVHSNLPTDDSGEIVITGAAYETLCDDHAAKAKAKPSFVWSRPLGLYPAEGD